MDVRHGRDLKRLRLCADADLTAALGRLQVDARAHLARFDSGYPAALTGAATELGRRYLVHVHGSVGPELPGPRWTPPPLPTPPERRRWSTEQWLFAVSAAPTATYVLRFAWSGGPPSPLVAGLAAAAALFVALWASAARRAKAERDRLDQWTKEVLNVQGRSLQTAVSVWFLDLEATR